MEKEIKGRIVQIIGPVIDVAFDDEKNLPSLLDALEITRSNGEKLITEVWGYDYFGDDRTLDTHIKLLRRSLGPYADFIVTLRGVGYRFDAEK